MDVIEAFEREIDGLSGAARVSLNVSDVRRAIVELATLRENKEQADAAAAQLASSFNMLKNKRVSAYDLMAWRNGPLYDAVISYPGMGMVK